MSDAARDPARHLEALDPKRRELVLRMLERKNADLSRVPVTRRRADAGEPPLSHAQERLWILDRIDRGNAAYNEPYVADLTGAVAPGALAAAWAALVRRHESLRTRLPEVDGEPVQRVDAPSPPPLPLVDLAALPSERRRREAQRLVLRAARRPFDLAAGPLLRLLLLRLRGDAWRLSVCLHHVICDARSLGLLFAELEELYDAARRRRAAALPPLPVQYPDFAVWQRRWLESGALERQLGWWRETLDGFPTLLEVPADHPRSADRGGVGGQLRFELPAPLSRGVQELARRSGATLFQVCLAAFAALLGAYTGRRLLLVGSPVANRRRPELERVVGFFVNTLPLPCDLTGDPSFAALVERLRGATLAAFDHQDVPFARLVDEVETERTAAHTPLVQVFFLTQRLGRGGAGDAGVEGPADPDRLTFLPRRVENGTTKFELTLVVDETPDGLRGHLDYDAGLFGTDTAARLVAGLRTLLAAAVEDPRRRLSELPVMDAETRRRVLETWRGPARRREGTAPVHRRILERAARLPQAPAVIGADGGVLSYGELARRATAVAAELRRRGVTAGTPVGLVAERNAETVVAILGTLAAGAAYVPLEPGLAPARRDLMLDRTGVALVLAPARHRGDLDGWGGDVLEPAATVPDGGADFVPPPLDDAHPAYVIHTSGSTGEPKGVVVTHGALNHLEAAFRDELELSADDRLLMVPAPTFDASVGNLFPVLAAGAALVLHPDPSRLGAAAMAALCRDAGVTVVDVPAAFWKAWLDGLDGDGAPPASLRLVIAGGESVNVDQVAAWVERTGSVFFGPYGPTEATVCTTGFRTGPDWRRRATAPRLPVGRPLEHVAVYLLDRHGRPVPPGVPGELHVGGAALARGYVGRPAATAEVFVPDPWSGEPGARLYRTGDLARWCAGGEIEFAGRVDDQIKIRGFRIEPGEVEAHLRRHPAVREAAVVAWQDGPAARLVAYVEAEGDGRPGADELAARLHDELPPYMVPARFVVLDRLPVTANGKVDRRALPEPAEAAAAAPPVAPRDGTEERLLDVWRQVLERDDFGVHDDFFRLGGDSILSLRIVARAAGEGLHLTPRQLFRHRTVAELAAVAGSAAPAAAEQGAVTGPVPLTPVQRWFFDDPPADPHHWNQSLLLAVEGGGAAADWRRAVAAVVRHHDALRLRFHPDPAAPAGWRQESAPPEAGGAGVRAPFTLCDLGGLPEPRRRCARRRAAAALQGSLDLGAGPLFRALLFRGAAADADRLLLVAHHLVVDAVSWRPLVEDLETARRGGVELPAKTTSFRAWAERLAERAASGADAGELPFWRRQVAGEELPRDRDVAGAGADTEAAAAEVRGELNEAETRRLVEETGEALQADVRELLLAALLQTLRRWSGRRRLTVNVEGHGREGGEDDPLYDGLDLSRTVGWFTAAHPLHLELPPGGGAGEVLKVVKARLRAVPRNGVGYGVLRWLGNGLADVEPQVSFNYLGRSTAGGGDGGDGPKPLAGEVGPLHSPRARRRFPLELDAGIEDGRLRWVLTYGGRVHRRDTAATLVTGVAEALRDLMERGRGAETPEYTAADFPLASLDDGELDKVVALLEEADEA